MTDSIARQVALTISLGTPCGERRGLLSTTNLTLASRHVSELLISGAAIERSSLASVVSPTSRPCRSILTSHLSTFRYRQPLGRSRQELMTRRKYTGNALQSRADTEQYRSFAATWVAAMITTRVSTLCLGRLRNLQRRAAEAC